MTCIIHKIDTEPTLVKVIQCQFRDTLTFPYLGIWLNIMHEVAINSTLVVSIQRQFRTVITFRNLHQTVDPDHTAKQAGIPQYQNYGL